MTFKDCFSVDEHKYNRIPKSIIGKIWALKTSARYSMPVYLRLTEFCYHKSVCSKWKIKKKLFFLLAVYFKSKNEIRNSFEHGYYHNIAEGTIFHHTGVTVNNGIIFEKDVQVFKDVTFAKVKGKVCRIGEGSVIFSQVIILGCRIGKNCVVGAGSVVINDVPDNSIVVGNPARVKRVCKDSSEYLESR